MMKLVEILNTDLPSAVLKTKGPEFNRNIRHICGIAEQLDYCDCQHQNYNFKCCLSVHVDNYTIIVPTKCTSLLKAQDITICTF
jgi:hypothetical protein